MTTNGETPTASGTRVRHLKRGSCYTVVATARLQTGSPIGDDTEVIVYRGDDGRVWVRPIGEFVDGRFEKLDDGSGA